MIEDSLKEKFSSLLDGELSAEESIKLLDQIERDPELQALWRRYNVVSSSMRSPGALLTDKNFVARVSGALAHEPTILAPRRSRSRLREHSVTTALAASLAFVAVVVGKSLNDYAPDQGHEVLSYADLQESDSSQVDPEFRDYLVLHNETAYLSGAQGMLPSVRMVSLEQTR